MRRLYGVNFVLLLVALGSASCIGQDGKNKSGSIKQSEMIIARQFQKWQNGEGNFFDIVDEQVVWTVSGRSPVSGIYKGKKDFMENSLDPITRKFKTPLKPELISLTSDSAFVWLHFKGTAVTKDNGIYANTYLWKMKLRDQKVIDAVAFLDTYELDKLMKPKNKQTTMGKTIEETKDYLGMWVTRDGRIRQELLTGNRYDEARGNQKSAYQGNYSVKGNHIYYKDDTGFSADGEFRNGILYHGGMVFHKEKK